MLNETSQTLQRRIAVLRWLLPVALGLLAVFYEIGPGRWLHDRLGASAYFDVDVVFYGSVAPLLAFWILTMVGMWLAKTERAVQRARYSERRLASIMSASADAILSLDGRGCVESWNRGAELLFGYEFHQVYGRPFTTLIGASEPAEVEFNWLMQTVRDADFVRGHETTCWDARGEAVAVELTATRLTDESHGFIGMSVILRNITDRKHRDEEIRRLNSSLSEQVAKRTAELAQKVEELATANASLQKMDQMRSEFVTLVSHQIRAPLTNMRGAAERMQTDCSVMNATCQRMFTVLRQQSERLDRLVRDVLNTARLEAGELVFHLEPISILPIIQQVTDQMHARTTQRSIVVPLKPGLPLVYADRDRVAEILANLLDNADKYSAAGSRITIQVLADEEYVIISVIDSGRGIPISDVDRIFDKFYRSDSSDAQAAYGYGLGLYVCRRLVEAQSGRIWVENAPGGGAVFSFSLPVAR